MRATVFRLPALAALSAALLLTSCSDGGSDEGGDATAACALGRMDVRVGPANAAPAAGDTGNVPVTLTNTGPECTLDGLPAVTLNAGDTSAEVSPDPAATARKLTLAEGGSLSFTVTYARGEGDQSLAAKTAEFTLPGADTTEDFPWSYGDVALKGGKPDATVSGFLPTGD
ncbi:DUF4232 domain-containing protein [Streptomyces sp. CC219B]|uniref:DUF4232 domain-containing protein n=1 Tax=Streptomyces sp. CC219B TaxID=3044574 RepID=UPI0024A7FA03|nr:DUF4232 domain-containing protein [Streptomyces sp. CC219B]